MARHAEDLGLALRVLAGPAGPQQTAWRVELPPPRQRRLGDFRVAVWTRSALCEIDQSVEERFAAASATLSGAGAKVDANARPPLDDEEHHQLFMLLLRAATASRMRDEDFVAQQEIAATLSPQDTSPRALIARGATVYHRSWGVANEARARLRHAWRDFFEGVDVLLTPVAATAAFPHDPNPDREQRLISVNGKPRRYDEQLFWSAPASLSYLPATAAPLGLTPDGLPVGMQIIGAEGDDLTTIEFARLLAAEIGGFTPPPDYR